MNRETFLTHLSLEVQTLEVWLEQEWLVPRHTAAAEPHFSEIDIARARLILDLTGGMGVNDAGVDIILHLLDQLHGFRRTFEGLNAQLGERRPG